MLKLSLRKLVLAPIGLLALVALLSSARAQINGISPSGVSVPHVGIFCVNSAGNDVVCNFGSGGSGGGGAVTGAVGAFVDGAIATIGTEGDVAWSGTGSGTDIAIEKAIYGALAGKLTVTPPSATPAAGTAAAIVTGGSAITLISGPVNGCYITNPLSASDQNIATAEVAYVNPVTTATANGRGTNSALQPGQGFVCTPGQTTNVSGLAATSGHAFSVVKW